jgi:hypothetical protein
VELDGGFDGFDGFVEQRRQKKVEARLHLNGLMVIQPVARASYPEPTGFKTVVAGFGAEQLRYTVARHQITGTNRFGQNSAEFTFCFVYLAAWRRAPCDLRLAEWYRTEQEAIAKYAPPPPAPEPTDCIASFAGDVQVELRRENRSRYLMWEVRNGRRTRRVDFSSPYLNHAKRTARLLVWRAAGRVVRIAGHQNKEKEIMELSVAKKGNAAQPADVWFHEDLAGRTFAGLHPETLRRRVRRGELAALGFPCQVAIAAVLEQFRPPACEK